MTHDADSKAAPRVTKAFGFAARLHAGQRRKGTDIPYLSHLMAVAALVQENGGDADQVIAALLHDGPEDRGGKKILRRIRRRFGDRVADIVENCSDTLKKRKPAWKPRKLAYLKHLGSADPQTLLVSLADKVHNLGCIVRDYREEGETLWERFNADRKDTLWYYRQLLAVYKEGSQPQLERLIGELTRLLDELDRLIEHADAS